MRLLGAPGAITLFEVMELTGCLTGIIHGLKAVSAGNAVAEVFLIGWAFVYLIEGASGFGKCVHETCKACVDPIQHLCSTREKILT